MKFKIGLIIIICIVVFAVCFLIIKNNNTGIKSLSGDNNINNEEIKKIDVPDDYLIIEKENIKTDSNISIDTIAYKDVSDESGDKTLVNVYITNVGNEPIYNNEVLTISLFNKNGDMLYCFGAIIESDKDIEKGESVVFKTQYLGKANDIVKAEVSFDHAD